MNPFIERAFTYHAPKPDQAEKYVQIRRKAKELAYLIDELCPRFQSGEYLNAIEKVQEAVMWANAAIARNE